ncbi:MAG: hypothetical protein U9Q70_09110, partial [Chloroflexota bacterium]|nr:hypothetical protein [Chloroflexota bacterium]
SDIFSLGIVLYEMLTGTLPFENIALAADPTYAPPSPRQLRPALPPALEEIVMRALAKNPVYRYQTAAEMQTALKRVPAPLDWGATARRTFAGVTLAAGLAAGGLGIRSCEVSPPPTSTPALSLTVATTTPSPTVTPVLTVPTATEQTPTSTPKPTLTPTNTLRPVIPIASPTPQGD